MGHAIRGFPPGHFLLQLGGEPVGDVKNVQGGAAVADLISEKDGADHHVRKLDKQIRYDDIVLSCGAGLSKTFYDWVDGAFRMQSMRKDGAVLVFNGEDKEMYRLDWHGGLISDFEFPALDAASKDPFMLTIKITPETTRRKSEKGSQPAAKARPEWLANSFRLSIDGLDEACKHVSRIEPITFAWKTAKDAVGEMRDYTVVQAGVEPGHLVITLPESQAQGFYDWFHDLVNKGQSEEKSGRLESGPFSLEFGNLGIAGISHKSDAPGAVNRNTVVEMYWGSIKFSA
jgi:phage tail-like protein